MFLFLVFDDKDILVLCFHVVFFPCYFLDGFRVVLQPFECGFVFVEFLLLFVYFRLQCLYFFLLFAAVDKTSLTHENNCYSEDQNSQWVFEFQEIMSDNMLHFLTRS